MPPAYVEAQLGARLGTMIRASQVIAFNPHTNREEEAVLLRLPPGYAEILHRTAGRVVRANGRAYPVGPL
eukprot:4597343-Lingulodinium_polyedra.AAC.1